MKHHNAEITFFHVLYNYLYHTWSVKIDDCREAVFTSESKDGCVAEAKRLAQESTSPKRRLLVRETNGVVVERVDYS